MSRSHASRALALWIPLSLVCVTGCTDPGLPWGLLEATVEARFDPPEGRLDDEGRLITSADYLIALDPTEVSFDALTLVLAGAGAAAFDPANPPEGYSLCHNGHCHAASGALVDYEDIALEMAGGSAGSRVTLALDGEDYSLSAGAAPLAVGVSPCDPAPCALPMGEMAGVELVLTHLSVSGTAFDRRTGEAARLTEEGIAFAVSVPVSQPLVYQVEGSIGPTEPVGVRVELAFVLPPELFDDIDFGSEPTADSSAWDSLLSAALLDHEGLEVVLTRFDD